MGEDISSRESIVPWVLLSLDSKFDVIRVFYWRTFRQLLFVCMAKGSGSICEQL